MCVDRLTLMTVVTFCCGSEVNCHRIYVCIGVSWVIDGEDLIRIDMGFGLCEIPLFLVVPVPPRFVHPFPFVTLPVDRHLSP